MCVYRPRPARIAPEPVVGTPLVGTPCLVRDGEQGQVECTPAQRVADGVEVHVHVKH